MAQSEEFNLDEWTVADLPDDFGILDLPRSGNEIDAKNPDPDEITVDDIAYGLSGERRYNAHTDPRINVAQHSVDTVRLLDHQGFGPEIQHYGLFHDGSEAFVKDIMKPLKNLLPLYEQIEEGVQDAVWMSLGVDKPSSEQERVVKMADNQLRYYEIENIYEDQALADERLTEIDTASWNIGPEELVTFLDDNIDLYRTDEESYHDFLKTYDRLSAEI
jgi:hypothetical protein